MECNKEEAIRAKGIAEKKMLDKDFAGAQKIALRAQRLYPDLENISQLLAVCDVHCSAEKKIFGNEMDWYGVLQVEQSADEASIKKQYRKLALLLHPDKNKFSGAEAAFKLIGEAQRLLLDKEKRTSYDVKRKASFRPAASNRAPAPQPANKKFNAREQPGVQIVPCAPPQFTNFNAQQRQTQQQTQPGIPNGLQTFWTVCPFCSVRYQYYIAVLNRALRCQSCMKPFIAHDINAQGVPLGGNFGQRPVTQQQQAPGHGYRPQVPENLGPDMGLRGNSGGEILKESTAKTGGASNVSSGTNTNKKDGNLNAEHKKEKGFHETKPAVKTNSKRKKDAEESSESFVAGSSTDFHADNIPDNGDDTAEGYSNNSGNCSLRRSSRTKQNVSYKEADEDHGESPLKKAKGIKSSSTSEEMSEDTSLKRETQPPKSENPVGSAVDLKHQKEVSKKSGSFEGQLPNGNNENKMKGKAVAAEEREKTSEATKGSTSNLSPRKFPDPEFYEYPDPDFNDFDKVRAEGCFSVGQIWAVYDTVDAMPRFYARIRKISPGFKLRITWLEPDPDDEDEISWVNVDLPVSCGKFLNGISENTEDRLMFSHLIYWEKGRSRNSFRIYPMRGETWALFKNWDFKWSSDPDNHRSYEFDFVEILSDYVEDAGISVAYLGKLKGFASVFCRTTKDGVGLFQVPPNELFRFSHRAPSFKLTGQEGEDVPEGSFELDPASLPSNVEEICLPNNLKIEICLPKDLRINGVNTFACGSCASPRSDRVKSMTMDNERAAQSQDDKKETNVDTSKNSAVNNEACVPAQASATEGLETPEPEFYNFDQGRLQEKFQAGQIWSLYSDNDGLPKYYALIKKIVHQPEFTAYVTWLEALVPNNMTKWLDKEIPICCGTFKLKSSKIQIYLDTSPFSHQLKVEETSANKKVRYIILPRKGEVWGLYKNWNVKLKASELEYCEYDIVEVVQENEMKVEVLVLERVNGFTSVFKPQLKDKCVVKWDIPRTELLKFSHQIPAFRLTEERSGSLRGYWELDPASVPHNILHLS
ncbi:DnaJ domain [Dillenia turbinata]|uniref:DnaJ domain n=1 Tax=Dillenia turbinata TaxID=194707 RepID=A0AAN8V813_9MAGN